MEKSIFESEIISPRIPSPQFIVQNRMAQDGLGEVDTNKKPLTLFSFSRISIMV